MFNRNNKLGNNSDSENNQNNDGENKDDNSTQVEKDAVVFQPPAELSEEPSLPKIRNSDVTFNSRKLLEDVTTYELEKFDKNYLLIFNHKYIKGFKQRSCTENDVAKLCATFEKMKFAVDVVDDLKKDDVIKKLKELAAYDFTDYGCVIVVVLSHGDKDGFIYAEDMSYSEVEIINNLYAANNPTLFTKPKVLLIQACRGYQSIEGVKTSHAVEIEKDMEVGAVYTLPNEPDLLLFHSSYIGKASMRVTQRQNELGPDLGSPFIQSVCKKINELASVMDLESVFREVKKEVAIQIYSLSVWNEKTEEHDIEKQMPVTTSTLTRKIYLKKFSEISMGSASTPVIRPQTSVFDDQTYTYNRVPKSPCPYPSQVTILDGQCCCFLYHFDYIKECLRFFVAYNPIDRVSKILLEIADSIENDDSLWNLTVKYRTAKTISNFLRDNRKDERYFNYLYFYVHK